MNIGKLAQYSFLRRGLFVSEGDISMMDVEDGYARIDSLRQSSGINRILSDERKQTSNSVTLDIAYMRDKVPSGLRIAVLSSDGQTQNEKSLFDSLARNQGCVVKRWQTKEEAIAWLCEDPDESVPKGLISRLLSFFG